MQKEAPTAASGTPLVDRVDELAALYRLTDQLYRAQGRDHYHRVRQVGTYSFVTFGRGEGLDS